MLSESAHQRGSRVDTWVNVVPTILWITFSEAKLAFRVCHTRSTCRQPYARASAGLIKALQRLLMLRCVCLSTALFHVSRQFLLFDVSNMEIIFEGRDSRSWIRACCFSPDGKSFAVASTDNKVYIYDSKSYALKAKVINGVFVGDWRRQLTATCWLSRFMAFCILNSFASAGFPA